MNTRRENKVPLHVIAGVFLLAGSLVLAVGANNADAAMADHLLINEVQYDSIFGAGGAYDDFVEIYNPSDFDVPLLGWSIQKQGASSTDPIVKKALSGTVPAHGYFLIVRSDASTAQTLKDKADLLAGSAFSISPDNSIYLVNNDENVSANTDENIVDMLGFGKAESFETLAVANSPEGKSLERKIIGEDTNNNNFDFMILDNPTPQNIADSVIDDGNENDVSGTVNITVISSSDPVRNINPTGADIYFSVNGGAEAKINYGLTSTYDLSSSLKNVTANTESFITLNGLSCATTYHYSVYAQDTLSGDFHSTADATFTTMPCGMNLDSLTMTKTQARANNQYADGWAWEFNITVWDMSETKLKMKFAEWSGPSTISAGGNMQFSLDPNVWQSIDVNNEYSNPVDISLIDDDTTSAGRQLKIVAQMKVPQGALSGNYNSNWGIWTEK